MTDSSQLLTHARAIIRTGRRGATPQVNFRRAVSAAYYALFHGLVAESSGLLAGRNNRKAARYLLVYRSFEHGTMAKACEQIGKERPPARLGIERFGPEIGSVAAAFANLQSQRHRADYDPTARFERSNVEALISSASAALDALSRAPPAERDVFLTFLLLRGRE